MKLVCGLVVLVCGLAAVSAAATSSRVVNGGPAPQGSTPFHAHLLIRTNQQATVTHVGSGTLITNNHILTSASNTRK